jgi:protein-S-isoprenylcysteine O-methyltransferase Ste14
MIVRIGNFLFHYRNGLFPLVYAMLFLKSPPLISDYRIAALLGLSVALLGQALRAVTIGLEYIVRGGRNRQVYADHLVQGGIFAHCRNPLYLGNFTILIGLGLASNSALFVTTALPFFAFAYWAIIAAEENYLRNKFGAEFDEYCSRVNRFVPHLAGLGQTLAGMHFNWRRLITAEYGSTYVWLVAIIGVTIKNAWLDSEIPPSRAMLRSLWILLAMATVAYGVARFFKKTGRLASPQLHSSSRAH